MTAQSKSNFRTPQFLTTKDHPLSRIRCPVHGFIHVSENERKIINQPLFRRLRYIRQLALTDFIYPGATHTRFEHALGVMELATKSFDSLATRKGGLLETIFKQVEGFKKKPLALARQLLRMAALLHDVGHASFSHAAEGMVNSGEGHEKLTVKIVRDRHLLGAVLDKTYGGGFGERIAQIVGGSPNLPPQLLVLKNLVSGEMDADRSDYLLRDSYHCGVEYGHFDHRWMIECLELREDPMGGLEIALHRDGLHTFEALILARYYMTTHVYQHRLRRIYDLYLKEYFKSLGGISLQSLDQIILNNDIEMIAKIFKDAVTGRPNVKKWAARIRDREHHKVIHETGLNADALDLRKSVDVMNALQDQYSQLEFLHDIAEASIHKLFVPGQMTTEGRVLMSLVTSDKRTRLVTEESQVLQTLPNRFQCARIFCDLSGNNKRFRNEIEKRASKEWHDRGGR